MSKSLQRSLELRLLQLTTSQRAGKKNNLNVRRLSVITFVPREGTLPPFQFVSEPWEGWGSSGILPAGQGESVGPMACSSCRCHPVIILKKPSAPAAPAGPALLSVGSCVTGSIQAALSSIQTCLQCPGGRSKGEGSKSLERGKVIDVAPFWACFWTVTSKVNSHLLMMSFPN